MARRRGRTAVDAHLSTSEIGCLLRHGLPCGIIVGPGHRSLLPPAAYRQSMRWPYRLFRFPTTWQFRNLANTDWRWYKGAAAHPHERQQFQSAQIVVLISIILRSAFDRMGFYCCVDTPAPPPPTSRLLSPKRCSPRRRRATASTPHARHVANPDFIRLLPMGAASPEGMASALRPGSQFTRRAAIASDSDAFQSPSGSIAIVTANARAGVSRGKSKNRAAPRHGSKPSRVNAVRTVSGSPTFSSPTAA